MTDSLHNDLARLRDLLDGADADTRGMAAVTLGRVGSEEAVGILLDMLADEDKRVVCAAAQSLGAREDVRATESLMALAHHDDVEVRRSALSALAQLADARAFAPVVTALFDSDDGVRRNAAAALGRMGDARALEPLCAALDDSYNWVRANAALSLSHLADERAVPVLEGRYANEDDPMVRGNIILALASCDSAYARLLIGVLGDQGEDDRVRVSAAVALASMASEGRLRDMADARDALCACLHRADTPDEPRAACAWSLGRLPKAAEAERALVAVLDNGYRWVVLYALESLALLGAASSVPALRDLKARKEREPEPDAELIERIEQAIQEIAAG